MVKQILPIYLLCFLLIMTSCLGTSEDSDWTIEWQFRNKADSLPTYKSYSFKLENTLHSTKRYGYIDTLGKLFIGITMPGLSDDVVSQNPTLHCTIAKDSITFFNTTVKWNELDFKEQYSELYKKNLKNVSKKIFYTDSN